jgi:hypothetical protein
MGRLKQDALVQLETEALSALRDYDVGKRVLSDTVERVLAYSRWFTWNPGKSELDNDRATWKARDRIERTLKDRPWKSCQCPVCAAISIEVMLFRGNNRNRRRGFHNLTVFNRYVKDTLNVLEYQ